MTEPKRLLRAGSPTARLLLRGAKRDQPPASLVPGLMGALGVVAVEPWVGSKLVLAIRRAALSKMSVGIAALAAAGGGRYVMGRMHERARQVAVEERPSTLVGGTTDVAQRLAPERPPAVARTAETTELAPSPATAATPTPRVERPAPRHGVAAPSPAAAANATPSIVGELTEIRHARSLVVADDGEQALVALDAYAAAHPKGTFEEEALVLRVRALRLTGDRVRADHSLHTLETRFPNSVYLAPLKP